MTFFKKLYLEDMAALSHIFLRILCLLIIEHECARLVEQSSGTPAVLGNYILCSIYGIGFLFTIINKKIGYLIAMSAGIINVIVKIVIIFRGHEHFPYYPIVWISQSLIVSYFCYIAYKKYKTI